MTTVNLDSIKVSPFYLRKMRTEFRCYAKPGRDFATFEEIEAFTERYKALAGMDSIREKQVFRKLKLMWDRFYEPIGHMEQVTPEVTAKCVLSHDRDTIVSFATQYADILFDLIDVNADGVISLNEYIPLLKLFQQDEKAAEIAFKSLDTNGDGVIGYDEFLKAVIDFYLPDEDEEKPSNSVFGPLAP